MLSEKNPFFCLSSLTATNILIYSSLNRLVHFYPRNYQRSLVDFLRSDQLIVPIYSSCRIRKRLISRAKLCSILIQRLLCKPVQFGNIYFRFDRSILCRLNRTLNYLPVTCVKTIHSLTLREVLSEHDRHNILYSRFFPKENVFVTCGDEGTVKIWNGSSRKYEMTLEGHSRCITSLQFHPSNSSLIATTSRDNTAKLWRLSPGNLFGTCIKTMEGHTDCVRSIAFHPRLPTLLTGSFDHTAKLWNLSSDDSRADCIDTIQGHEAGITFVAFNHTNPFIALIDIDGYLAIWSMPTDSSRSQCIDSLQDELVQSVAIHPRDPFLAVGCKTGAIILMHLDPNNFTIRSRETVNQHSRKVMSIAFHPTAPLLASKSSDNTVKIWRLSQHNLSVTCVETLHEDNEGFHSGSVEFDPKNSQVITTCGGTTKVWR